MDVFLANRIDLQKNGYMHLASRIEQSIASDEPSNKSLDWLLTCPISAVVSVQDNLNIFMKS